MITLSLPRSHDEALSPRQAQKERGEKEFKDALKYQKYK